MAPVYLNPGSLRWRPLLSRRVDAFSSSVLSARPPTPPCFRALPPPRATSALRALVLTLHIYVVLSFRLALLSPPALLLSHATTSYLRDMYILDTDPIPEVKVAAPSAMVLLQRNLGSIGDAMSDVTFVLHDEAGREQYVNAHRVVLACVSVRFRALFTSGFRESTYGVDDLESEQGEEEAPECDGRHATRGASEKQRGRLRIDVPDVTHAVFVAMIEYLYTGSAAALEFAYRATPPLRSPLGGVEGDDLVQLELQRERILFVVALMQVRAHTSPRVPTRVLARVSRVSRLPVLRAHPPAR